MEVWLTYDPRDLLLFSSSTYWRMFERLNADLWPLTVAAPLIVLAGFGAALRGQAGRRLLAGLLAAAWAIAAWAFLPLYGEINWAAGYVAPLFWAEAALLVLALLHPAVSGWMLPGPDAGPRLWGGLALAGSALLLWPVLPALGDRSIASAEMVAVAPDPTALVTLAMLAVFGRGWGSALAGIIPLVWCLASAATLLTMGETAQGGLLLGATLGAAMLLALPRRR